MISLLINQKIEQRKRKQFNQLSVFELFIVNTYRGKYLKDFKKTDLIVFPSSSPGSTSFEALLPALQVLKIYPPLKEKRQVISKRISDLRLKRQKAQEIKQI